MASEPKLRGLARLMPAFHNTLAGLRAAWAEPAFHMEAWAALLMAPCFCAGPNMAGNRGVAGHRGLGAGG
jgi:diacylglycerol kinase